MSPRWGGLIAMASGFYITAVGVDVLTHQNDGIGSAAGATVLVVGLAFIGAGAFAVYASFRRPKP